MDQQLKNEILEAVEQAFKKADRYFGYDFPRVLSRFDLTGTTAGYFCTRSTGNFFRFNVKIAKENREHYLKQTVPHEVAHAVARGHYNTRRIKPHGSEWKMVMTEVMGVPATRCHSYDVSSSRKMKTFDYACGCQVHKITLTRVNKIKRGTKYTCRKCKQSLAPANQGELNLA